MNTIDTTKEKKINQHRKDLDKALVALENAKEVSFSAKF